MALLENNNIRLRALEPEDLDVLFKWENDTDLWRYGNTLTPYSRYVLKEYLLDSRQDIFQSRQLRLMIVLKENNVTIGTIDLYDFDPMNSRAGVGILIDSGYRGKGISQQALKLMEEYAFGFLLLKQLFAHVPQRNEISRKLFTKCGYEQTGCLEKWIRINDDFDNILVLQLINKKV